MLIGVFDSGLGGISVLNECRKILPLCDYIYCADDAHAPYGNLPHSRIVSNVSSAIGSMLSRDISCLVVACNTATSAAADCLRKTLSIPVIGTEPAIAPCVRACSGKKILLICTQATAALGKLHALIARYPDQKITVLPMPDLAQMIEQNISRLDRLRPFLSAALSAYRDYEAVVLGCTHYCFARQQIAEALPNAQLFDGNLGIARRLAATVPSNTGNATVDLILTSNSTPRKHLYHSLITPAIS